MTRGARTGAASRGTRSTATNPSRNSVSTVARQTRVAASHVESSPAQRKSVHGGRVNVTRGVDPNRSTTTRVPLASIQTPPPSTDPVDCDEEADQERITYIGKRKRTYEEISDALGSTKRQRTQNEILEPYYQLGRWTQRGIDLDPDVHHIIKVGIALSEEFSSMDGVDSFAASEEVLEDYTEQEQQSILALFNEMISYESDLEPLLAEIINQEDIETFNNLLDEV
ncbi:hypothetical protein K435DRAFT_846655, partial [Dendrothele bispora CBS 962.96]